jgi:hypothetical protein
MGWGPAKSLDLRSSAPGGVLQEIELGEKRCHDLKLRVFVSHLRKIAKQEIAKQEEVRRPFAELDKATFSKRTFQISIPWFHSHAGSSARF